VRTELTVSGFGCLAAAKPLAQPGRVPGRRPPAFRATRHSPPATHHAFSLIEILVVIGLLSVIILGLLMMFNQTQKAFRVGMTQTDVLEGGRMTTDLMSRELEQMTASYLTNLTPNFYAQATSISTQTLPPNGNLRTNLLEDLFFLTRQNQTWTGVGYFVRTNDALGNLWIPTAGFGTLYRFSTNFSASQFTTNCSQMYSNFLVARFNGNAAGVSKIVDGVVDFKFRAFNTNGIWINPANPNLAFPFNNTGNIIAAGFPTAGEVGLYRFYSNAVPASVELDIGILEQATWQRLQSIPAFAAQTNYFAKQAGHVQLFRQRVAVRTVDPSAYQ
jgi:prepilin-type N-terminal cleavage/methylation domain-containing protein